MFTFKRLLGSSLFVLVLAGTVLTQEIRTTRQAPGEAVAPLPAGPLVTATASTDRVRFVAPGTVIQVRLEVYNEAGQKVFDTELRGGNVLDWLLQDGAGQRLTAGSYASLLTVKSLSGRLSQRVGLVKVHEKTVALEAIGVTPLTGGQQQSIGPVESDAGFRLLGESEAAAMTAVTHDGTIGQLNRTAGALSFRMGNFFSGADTEQMRLTEEGNLGIGTEAPEFKLDVAGAVRGRMGFVFGNGSSLNVNEKGALQLKNADGELIPDASGAGTQGRLARWIDGAGTLGDSVINDTGTALQLTAAPNIGFDTNLMYLNSTNGTTGVLAGSLPSYSANNGPFFAMRGNTYTTLSNQRGIFTISAGNVGSPGPLEGVVKFNTGNDQIRMLITAAGNVGIGTNAPTATLDVAGNINTSTQYNIGGNRVLRIGGPAGLFAGSSTFAGTNAGTLNTGNLNSFFGNYTGHTSLGVANNENSFFGAYAGFHAEGSGNTAVGSNSYVGTGGNNNTAIGSYSFIGPQNGASNISNATAIGVDATVTQSNSLVLGSINGLNFSTVDTNVGIGTSAPASRLHIAGAGSDGAGQTDLRITGLGAIGSGITLQSIGAGGRTYSWLSTANDAGAGGGRLALFDASASAYRMAIDSSGKMGIGTTAPTYKLHIVDPSNTGLRVHTTTAGGTVASFASNGDFQIDAVSVPGGRFAVMEGGNVGVNTSTPGAKLQVVGGDVAITTQSRGLILKAIDGGNCFRLTINNAGALGATIVPCP